MSCDDDQGCAKRARVVESDVPTAAPLAHRSDKVMALARAHAHPMDARIEFVEEGHKYYLDGEPLDISVTGLIESVASEHFDPDAALRVMKRPGKWPNVKYADVAPDGTLTPWTDARIKKTWTDNGKAASDLGTDLHGKIELYLNGEPLVYDDKRTNEPEFGYFLKWWEARQAEGYEAYRTEWVIFDADVRLAGSIDFVMRNTVTGKYAIVDWKRCQTKEAGFAKSFGRKFLAPLASVDQHKLNKWSLQVNVYREILETRYGLDIDSMAMVVCHCENPSAEEHHFPRTEHARAVLDARLKLQKPKSP